MSSKITKDEVEHIAKLARLNMNAKEVTKYQKELSAILEFVNKLNEIKTDRSEVAGLTGGPENVMRNDIIRLADKKTLDKLMKAAPNTENGHIKVKAVL